MYETGSGTNYSPDDLSLFQGFFNITKTPIARDIGGGNSSAACKAINYKCSEVEFSHVNDTLEMSYRGRLRPHIPRSTHTHPSTHPLIHPCTHPLIYSSIHALIHPSIHSSTHPSMHSSIHALTHSSIHALTHSSIHVLTHSSIHALIHPCRPIWTSSSSPRSPRTCPRGSG